jgi:REP element-mobilizing transposase RayT
MEPRYPQRKPNRLKDFDYSHAGRYFITICTFGRSDYFGEVEDGTMHLNRCGEFINGCIDKIAEIHPNIRILCKAVMPDHIHFIMELLDASTVGVAYHATRQTENTTRLQNQATNLSPNDPGNDVRKKSKMMIPRIVQQFKTATQKEIKQMHTDTELQRLQEDWVYGDGLHEVQPNLYWQRGYHDHIIRTDEEYENMKKYIEENPKNWREGEHLGEYAHDNS